MRYVCLICDYDGTIAKDGRCAASTVEALPRVCESVGLEVIPPKKEYNLSNYFTGLADKTGLSHQKLIDFYLLDCARKRKKPSLKWVA